MVAFGTALSQAMFVEAPFRSHVRGQTALASSSELSRVSRYTNSVQDSVHEICMPQVDIALLSHYAWTCWGCSSAMQLNEYEGRKIGKGRCPSYLGITTQQWHGVIPPWACKVSS